MNTFGFALAGATLQARATRTLWWPEQQILCVSDLHLGKSERISRRSGTHLPPYETRDTIERLRHEIEATGARHVIALGDSFDDARAAENLHVEDRRALLALSSDRNWTWIAGNHDPEVEGLPGTWRKDISIGPLHFRHIADPARTAEISGHYHPKARPPVRGAGAARACFLIDRARVVMPAFGTYTGGLSSTSTALCGLMSKDAIAVLTGTQAHAVPMPRLQAKKRPFAGHLR